MKLFSSKRLFIFTGGCLFLLLSSVGYAQNIESRVAAVEDYLSTIQPTLLEFSEGFETSLRQYSLDLENSLNKYGTDLQISLDERFRKLDRRTVDLDVNSTAFKSIETNTGLFLISVDRLEKEVGGNYKLILNVGNPNYADFKGFRLNLLWGNRFYPSSTTYNQWRSTLDGAEYTFEGSLPKGAWSQATIELDIDSTSELAHLEASLEILTVQLESK